MSKFYNPVPILKVAMEKKSPTVVIVGGKGNGKTYGIIEKALEEFVKSGRICRYLRRYKESITPKAIQSLLKPQRKNLMILTGGQYNDFQYWRGRFYLVKVDKDGNRISKKNEPFMVCSALNSVEGFTGADEGDCSMIFFDEFLSRERELPDEFSSLMIFHNNCVRNRLEHYTPLILVGNTVSRNSTLAREFGIDLYSIDKDTITVLTNHEGDATAVVEYCGQTERMADAGETIYKRYDHSKVKMIYSGDWSIGNYPRITERHIKGSEKIFTIMCDFNRQIVFEIRLYKSYVFGYVRYRGRGEECDCILTTRTTPLRPNVLNYFTSTVRVFRVFGQLILRKQVFFDCGECGEIFRDFLLNLNGANQLQSVYK